MANLHKIIGIRGRSLSGKQKRFVILYALILLLSFSPLKSVGLLLPLLSFLGLIFYVQCRPKFHIAQLVCLIALNILLGIVYCLLAPEYSILNQAFFFVTASCFVTLLWDLRELIDTALIVALARLSIWMLFFESLFGILQALLAFASNRSFDLSNGDLVRGTVELTFGVSNSGSNQIFAVLISSLLFFVLATSTSKPTRLQIMAVAFGVLAWVLASVLHTMLFAAIAVVLGLVFTTVIKPRKERRADKLATRNRRRRSLFLFFIIAATSVLILVFLPTNLQSLPVTLSNALEISPDAISEKSRATYNTLFLLPQDNPLQPLIGMGPGQYSSRASLIASGEYLQGTTIPFSPQLSKSADEYILSLYRASFIESTAAANSSSRFPFYSWLTLYGELGFIGLTIFLAITLKRIAKITASNSDEFKLMRPLCLMLWFYILLMGIQDNYWEWTQAMFLAFLNVKILATYLEKNSMRSPRHISESLPVEA